MKKTYYLFNSGRLSRRDNTLKFVAVNAEGQEQPAKYLPVEGISDLYVLGALDVNSALLNFLGRQRVAMHFFGYHENYTGSFMPKDYLLAGKMQVAQTRAYLDTGKRLAIARLLIEGAVHNILRNLKYYQHRERDLEAEISAIEALQDQIKSAPEVAALMGIEGNIRQIYYSAFDIILKDFMMEGRSKRPPQNEVNALVSFGNMVCYTVCLSGIYHTQLNPTISFLHEPGARRYSLALDLAEIFKPLLVDRVIFKIINKKEIKSKHFSKELNRCLLKDNGRKIFLKAWEERLEETIKHRTLGRKVKYKTLIRLECYKLAKHLLNIEPYLPFRAWW